MTLLLQLTQNLLIHNASLLAQVDYSYTTQGKPPGPLFWICWLVFVVLMVAALWKVFSKAGHPGWAAIIPIVNTYFLIKVAGRPGWWLILMFIPLVNFIIWIILCIDVAKNFGKGTGFGIGLLLLPFIFFLILGFGSAQYQGQGAVVSQPAQKRRSRVCVGQRSGSGRSLLHDPLCLSLLVKGCDAFTGFIRFARLQMILQRKFDIFLY